MDYLRKMNQQVGKLSSASTRDHLRGQSKPWEELNPAQNEKKMSNKPDQEILNMCKYV